MKSLTVNLFGILIAYPFIMALAISGRIDWWVVLAIVLSQINVEIKLNR